MFVVAFIGIDRLPRVDFDLKQGPVSYIQQAIIGLGHKLARWVGGNFATVPYVAS